MDILAGRMVRALGLSKTFHEFRGKSVNAVVDLSFEAPPGQIFGLLGVNGAGKTTALRMLSTVIAPTSGSATVAGYDVRKDAAKVRASIGFMSASTALYGRLTPREFLSFFGAMHGVFSGELKRRVQGVLTEFEIEPYADRLCDKLSTGQKQRVSIARTVIHNPPVVIFDEPTAGLDVLTSQTVLRFIEAERDRGKTVLFSTHRMVEAERLCDVVGVIHGGTLRAMGSNDSLRQRTGSATLEEAFLKLVEGADSIGPLSPKSPAEGAITP